jgi:hypothetical protein
MACENEEMENDCCILVEIRPFRALKLRRTGAHMTCIIWGNSLPVLVQLVTTVLFQSTSNFDNIDMVSLLLPRIIIGCTADRTSPKLCISTVFVALKRLCKSRPMMSAARTRVVRRG